MSTRKIFLIMVLILVPQAYSSARVPAASSFEAINIEVDLNNNRIADALEDSVKTLIDLGKADSLLRFVAQFTSPVEDQDVELVLRKNGEVSHRYSHAIYGIAGKIPAFEVDALAAELGGKLKLLDLDAIITLGMNTSVPQTRARPLVWKSVADGGYGIDGDPNTTIAILDSGLDMTHPDLAGKLEYWHDFHEEAIPTVQDFNGHGTFVAGIACGTGEVGGSSPIDELSYTYWSINWDYWDEGVNLYIPVLGSGQVTLDMLWEPSGEFCAGLWPVGGPESPVFCGSTSPYVHTWSIDEPGFFTLHHPFPVGLAVQWSIQVTTPYEHPGDGFNLFKGMAPDCHLAGLKIANLQGNGTGFVSATIAAMDFLVSDNSTYRMKVANLSSSTGGANEILREAASAVVTGGTVLVGITGNGYPGLMGDPARSRHIITVGAVNHLNALTNYTSRGIFERRPDVLAPGGSYPPYGAGAGLVGVDSNDSDGFDVFPPYFFHLPDRIPDDYCNHTCGTSWAAPHVTGLAALVIDALESTGHVWNYTQEDALLVKNLILMTATETGQDREDYSTFYNYNPSVDRGGKDLYEGYGVINADAAIEAVFNTWPDSERGQPVSITFGNDPTDRRCWAAAISTESDTLYLDLSVPATLDADVYIYRANFDDGDPDLVASAVNPEEGDDESLVFVPESGVQYYLTVKRISGEGVASLGLLYSPVGEAQLPGTTLAGVYPNPFNPRTTIRFYVGQSENITVSVYDAAGRQIAVIENRIFNTGMQEVIWDGSDSRGSAVASGPYFLRVQSASGVQQEKVMLVR